MSITSLGNFGVYVEDQGSQTLLMPKLTYRYRVMFYGLGFNESWRSTLITKQIESCERPTVQFEELKLPVYNSTVYLAGRYEFSELSIVVRDSVDGSVQAIIGDQMQKQFDFMNQASARSGEDYKFTTHIEILDGGNGAFAPVTHETFALYGCFIKQADYANLAYEQNEAVKITMSLRFDNAVQFKEGESAVGPNGGIGGSHARSGDSRLTTGFNPDISKGTSDFVDQTTAPAP